MSDFATDVTKEEFEAYEDVRQSGMFNMFTEARLAAMTAGLTINRYWKVLNNYSQLAKLYKTKK